MWYQYLLVAACAFAWWQGGRELNRTAIVLLANAAILSAWFAISGNNDNINLAMAVDIVSAYIIMTHPAGREQGWLAMTFAFQIGAHVSAKVLTIRGISISMIQPSYFEILNYAFLLQIAILVAWSETHGGRLADALDRALRHFSHRASGAGSGR